MGNVEVAELLNIANGHLPRVRLEYDRLSERKRLLEAELKSWKAEVSSAARTYQRFCDRNLALKNREDELKLSINKLEAKQVELRKTTTGLEQHLAELQENNAYHDNLNSEVKQQYIISTDDIFKQLPNMIIDYPSNENEILQIDIRIRELEME